MLARCRGGCRSRAGPASPSPSRRPRKSDLGAWRRGDGGGELEPSCTSSTRRLLLVMWPDEGAPSTRPRSVWWWLDAQAVIDASEIVGHVLLMVHGMRAVLLSSRRGSASSRSRRLLAPRFERPERSVYALASDVTHGFDPETLHQGRKRSSIERVDAAETVGTIDRFPPAPHDSRVVRSKRADVDGRGSTKSWSASYPLAFVM